MTREDMMGRIDGRRETLDSVHDYDIGDRETIIQTELLGGIAESLDRIATMAGLDAPVVLSEEQAEVVLMVLEEELDQLEPDADEWLGEYPGEDEVESVAGIHAAIMEQVTEKP